MSELFNSIITKVSNNLSELIFLQGYANGIFDYVNLIESISKVTYEAARILLEETIQEMDHRFRYCQHRVHQFYVKCKRTRTRITSFG